MEICKHMNVNFSATVGRFPEQGNWLTTTFVKCGDCGCDFYFYGVQATGEPTPTCATISDDKRQLRIFIGPEETTWGIPDGQRRQ